MKLQLLIIKIGDVQFGEKTLIQNGVLFVNREEIKNLLKEDSRLIDIEVEVARPGEKCRILNVVDVLEPRCKGGDCAPNFLGPLSGQGYAGIGETFVLKGVGIVLSEYEQKEALDDFSKVKGMIDMWGPGGDATPYSKINNVVILAHPSTGVTIDEYRVALKIAGLKTAAYLAKAAERLPPDEVKVYELNLSHDNTESGLYLPRVTYIFQLLSTQFEPLPGDPVLYGDNVEKIVPTILHPNEILDGAITAPYGSIFMETYFVQNHPIVEELYRRHGTDFRLLGIIVMTAPNNVAECERVAYMAANLAKYVLHAEGAVLTKAGGGAPEWVMMRTAQRCEQLGIKTALAFLHMGIDVTDPNPNPTTLFYAPEVDAMVSMGAPVKTLKLPRAARIIGEHKGIGRMDEEMEWPIRHIRGSLSQLGNSYWKAVRY